MRESTFSSSGQVDGRNTVQTAEKGTLALSIQLRRQVAITEIHSLLQTQQEPSEVIPESAFVPCALSGRTIGPAVFHYNNDCHISLYRVGFRGSIATIVLLA
jgi:hypothetical protein